jgi:membrane dipeptidase
MCAVYRPPIVGNVHCDYHLEFSKRREENRERATLERHYLPKLEAGGVDFEFYTVGGDHRHFTRDDDLTQGTLRMIDHVYAELQESPHFALATSAAEVRQAKSEGKKALILAIEGAAPVREDLSLLRNMHRLGLRSICLTWFKANPAADGVNEARGGGLSNFGRELVPAMNELGMVIDVSQATDAVVDDVLALSKSAIVASHSGCRAVHNHPRNLTDDQLRRVAQKGGLLGLTSFPRHLGSAKPTLEAYFAHLDHAVRTAGVDHVCLGLNIIVHDPEIAMRFFDRSRIDYEELWLPGLEDIDKVPAIIDGLLRRGYGNGEIDKIMGGNLLRLVGEVIG